MLSVFERSTSFCGGWRFVKAALTSWRPFFLRQEGLSLVRWGLLRLALPSLAMTVALGFMATSLAINIFVLAPLLLKGTRCRVQPVVGEAPRVATAVRWLELSGSKALGRRPIDRYWDWNPGGTNGQCQKMQVESGGYGHQQFVLPVILWPCVFLVPQLISQYSRCLPTFQRFT